MGYGEGPYGAGLYGLPLWTYPTGGLPVSDITSPQILIDGTWMTALASWGDLVITDRWPGGNWEASWKIPLSGLRRFTQLRARVPVEIRFGGCAIWAGFLTEPNWNTGEMIALGSVRRGEEAVAIDAGGLTNSIPDVAVDAAIARGAVDWIRRSSVSNAVFGTQEQTDAINYVAALLDAYTRQAGKGWGVDAYRNLYVVSAPTTPTLRATPASGVLGVADDVMAARVYGRYTPLAGGLATVNVGAGSPEIAIDLTKTGNMDATRATQIITGIYNQLGARTGWVNGLELTADQVTSISGARVGLAAVSAGARGPIMMRLDGLRDERGISASTDIVVGETVWNVTAGTVQVNPVGLVARDLAHIIEQAGVVTS